MQPAHSAGPRLVIHSMTPAPLLLGRFFVTLLLAVPLVARAVDAAALDALSREITGTRVVELPATITRSIANVPPSDRPQVATTAVIAALRTHPAAVGPCVLAAVRAAPESTEAIVVAASETLPGSTLALVSAAADAGDAAGDRVIAAMERRYPQRAAAFEREVALVQARRLLGDRLPPADPLPTPQPRVRPAPAVPPVLPDGVRP